MFVTIVQNIWFNQIRSKGDVISDEVLCHKASILQDAFVEKLFSTNELEKLETYKHFKFSNEWLEKFKRRGNISWWTFHTF